MTTPHPDFGYLDIDHHCCLVCGAAMPAYDASDAWRNHLARSPHCREQQAQFRYEHYRGFRTAHYLKCRNCGGFFYALSAHTRYCANCTPAANNVRRKQARVLIRGIASCAQCGAPYAPKRTDSRYCRPACRQAAHRQRAARHPASPVAPA